MTSNRSGALVPSEERPSFDADLTPLENDVAGEVELDTDLARGDRQMRRLGFTDEEIDRARGREAGEAPRSAVPTRQAIERELAELAQLRKTNRSKYWSPEVQAREVRLIELRAQLDAAKAPPAKTVEVAGDGSGISPELLERWERTDGGTGRHLAHAQATADAILGGLDEGEREALVASFDHDLSESARTAIYDAISFDGASGWRPAKPAEVAAFTATEEGAALAAEWGRHAARKIGIVRGRVGAVLQSLSPADRQKAEDWIDSLTSAQAKAAWRALCR